MGRKRNKFRGDLWIMLMMGFLLLWVVLAHELEGYKRIDGELGRWEDREKIERRTINDTESSNDLSNQKYSEFGH